MSWVAGSRRSVALRQGLGVVLMVIVLAAPPLSAGALSFPTAQEVIDRVRATVRHTDLASTNMVIKFRFGKPVAAPPDCVFQGVLDIWPDRLALTVNQWTPTPMCWLIERYVLGRLLEDRDRADSLLPLFRFEVIGEKLVDGRVHYLVYGRALARETDPQWLIGWVDYDRGLVTDGTVRYSWGEVNSVQEYGLVASAWIPEHQYLDIPRFRASLEIFYSGFRFTSGSMPQTDPYIKSWRDLNDPRGRTSGDGFESPELVDVSRIWVGASSGRTRSHKSDRIPTPF